MYNYRVLNFVDHLARPVNHKDDSIRVKTSNEAVSIAVLTY